MNGPDPATIDNGLGALLGLAVGDALGTTLEFSARDSGPPLTDMVGGGPFALEPGQWTDDTAMALALAETLAGNNVFHPQACMNRFVNWYRRGAHSCTGTCFDIGITTRTALTVAEETGEPFSGPTNSRSAGNGSLMRLSPVALWGWDRDAALVAQVARDQSRLTHGADECLAACEGFAALLVRAIRGEPKAQLLAPHRVDAPRAVAEIFGGAWQGKARSQISSSGYVVHSLEAALWCVGNSDGFDEAVLLAANLGDDADTVAAITGQLAGAIYGAGAIPAPWRARLAWRDEISAVGLRLLTER